LGEPLRGKKRLAVALIFKGGLALVMRSGTPPAALVWNGPAGKKCHQALLELPRLDQKNNKTGNGAIFFCKKKIG